ncbi:P-loop containing nucleoside triphosphate hydrolase protein [Zychaea mexicana]|uniref:P-loop containing nucleoside triphosphate hydrolase protein n=1 Tax=Zychaea mexicana TaxID=64656 RepID=UPI0022FED13E|nr:P-loop containing nucleoside triphosphate hydrolase protein [Zychaea mexicana]KAI9496662.1 P-loop containing nucleoside triphosphate hydrolase protein [Zychaea mexicana]
MLQNLCDNLQRHFGIQQPTIAQSQFIPAIQSGRDLLIRDQTGTGKTFGIAIALASKIVHANDQNDHSDLLRTLYIVPNYELAAQIGYWIRLLSGFSNTHRLVQANTCVPAHTLISTPARLLESLDTIPFSNLNCIVLEEADQALRLPARYAPLKKQKKRASNPKPTQMLVSQLLQELPTKPQVVAASATLNRPLRHWMTMQGWIRKPVYIDVTKNVEALNGRTQHYCLFVSGGEIRNIGSFYGTDIDDNSSGNDEQLTDGDDNHHQSNSQAALLESIAVLHEIENVHNAVLFVDTSVSTSDVARQLAEYGLRAHDIRDYDQEKDNIIDSSNQGDNKTPLWIGTEFSARGMDIANVSHVFILGEPSSVGGYVHMAGRTGRLSPQGIQGGKVITLVEDRGRAETRMSNMYKMLNAQVGRYEHVQ